MNLFTFRNETDRSLETEIMVSDRLRAAIVGTAFLLSSVGLFLLWTQRAWFETGPAAVAFLAKVPYPIGFVTLAVLGAYEWGYRFLTGALMARGLKTPMAGEDLERHSGSQRPNVGASAALHSRSSRNRPQLADGVPVFLLSSVGHPSSGPGVGALHRNSSRSGIRRVGVDPSAGNVDGRDSGFLWSLRFEGPSDGGHRRHPDFCHSTDPVPNCSLAGNPGKAVSHGGHFWAARFLRRSWKNC